LWYAAVAVAAGGIRVVRGGGVHLEEAYDPVKGIVAVVLKEVGLVWLFVLIDRCWVLGIGLSRIE
jgi:hypothetical protein